MIHEYSGACTTREIAERFSVSCATVHKWSHRVESADASCRPKRIGDRVQRGGARPAPPPASEQWSSTGRHSRPGRKGNTKCIAFKYRLLKRNGVGRIPQPPKPEHGTHSKDIKPGFLHIDSFKLFGLSGKACRKSASSPSIGHTNGAGRRLPMPQQPRGLVFLAKCQRHFPFALHTIVTDNGVEYTLKASAPAKHAKGFRRPFEVYCSHAEIEHRTSKPHTPKTNGLVERMNGEVKTESFAAKNTSRSPRGTRRLAPGTTTITETERIETYQLPDDTA